ncbi:MAG: chromate transporter [Clostridia bacterium]|nr:chromate transporter [Clostridia bacterium]
MIFLELFITFFYIGATTFGGGYAMIPLVREQVLAKAWLSEAEFINMIAVAEATPGPVAINMATFIGSREGGILGSALATLGVVLPSFLIILLIVSVIKNFLKYKVVDAFLGGVRPVVVGLITATAVTMFLSNLLHLSLANATFSFSPDLFGIVIFAILMIISTVYKKIKKRAPSPIIMILLSAALGIAFYSFK